MSKPFDITTRELLEGYPEPWLAYLGVVPDGPVQVIDSDLSTVPATADKVFRIDGPVPYIVHIEVQASADSTLPRRLWRYNALLDLRHDFRVQSVAVLLRPKADTANLTGILELHLPSGQRVVEFRYETVRAWKRPVEPILAGALGTLPLAPLADVSDTDVATVIERIDARLIREAPAATAAKIMEMTLLLAGLRLNADEINELRGKLPTMNITTESSYWRLAVEEGQKEGLKEGLMQGKTEGAIEGAQRVILHQGQTRFGPPDEETRKKLEAIKEMRRLEELGDRLLVVSSWAELLAVPDGP